jgi:hypothetical protein
MRPYLAMVMGAGPIVGLAASAGIAWSQLAPEGRGLLSLPAETLASLGSIPPKNPFVRDPSGGFSRTVFETDEDPNFRLVIREFSFPPDGQNHIVTLPSGAFLEIIGGQGAISIARQQMALTAGTRMAVSAGAPIEVLNNGEQPVFVRVLSVAAK